MNKVSLRSIRIPSKYLRIGGIVILSLIAVLLIGGIVAYNKREFLLEKAIDKAVRKAKNDYNLNVKIGAARFEGLTTVDFQDISVVPQDRDSLAKIKHLSVQVKLLPLITGDVKLAEVALNDGHITLIRKDSIRNYDFLFRKKGTTSRTSKKVDLSVLANNLINQVLYKIPDNMNVRDFEVSFTDDTSSVNLYTSTATIEDGQVRSDIQVNKAEAQWHVEGQVNADDQKLDLRLYADGKKVELPYLEKRFGLKLNFDTVRTQMKDVKRVGDRLVIQGSWAIKNLLINHPRIAANDIIVPSGSIDADMSVGENYVAIDSSSVIHLKNVKANPFIKYTLSPAKTYELKLHTEELDAQEVFDAFPVGLFESLDGMKVSGKLRYDFNFFLDSANPDSVRFNSTLDQRNFKVLQWGKTNLEKINRPFVYTPYEYGKPMRDIVIGPSNPDYTPINEISPYLRNAVLTAEDPSFYRHNGFVMESFRKSIATNYKEKAFKRGGSTISMQLVKNVYLNRQKTLARKIEEILIVWILENTDVSSKQRMFEVYLNLIEWGKNVYGIGEAARYYFNKQPSELDLGESIYLASIVPRPKSSLYFFEGDGSLRPSLRGYFRLIGGLMARKGLAQPDSNVYGFYAVRLKESLRREPAPIDSALMDSLILEEDFDMDHEGFLRSIFGRPRKDTTQVNKNNRKQVPEIDTALTPAEKRRERREQRRKERQEKRDNGGGGF
ncbi:MAG TPA: transglycosylase domain-containing protein [Sphingobacteriaceae bacterium]